MRLFNHSWQRKHWEENEKYAIIIIFNACDFYNFTHIHTQTQIFVQAYVQLPITNLDVTYANEEVYDLSK